MLGHAYIPVSIFDEFVFHPESHSTTSNSGSQSAPMAHSSVFEIPLDALLECLNIFGSGAPVYSSNNGGRGKWRGDPHDEDDGPASGRRPQGGRTIDLNTGGTRLDQYFQPTDSRKTTMRMSYAGIGNPLTFLLWVKYLDNNVDIDYLKQSRGCCWTCHVLWDYDLWSRSSTWVTLWRWTKVR